MFQNPFHDTMAYRHGLDSSILLNLFSLQYVVIPSKFPLQSISGSMLATALQLEIDWENTGWPRQKACRTILAP